MKGAFKIPEGDTSDIFGEPDATILEGGKKKYKDTTIPDASLTVISSN
jgi:hypothetical protein